MDRVEQLLRELARRAQQLRDLEAQPGRCDAEAARGQVAEAYGLIAARLVELEPDADDALARALDLPDPGLRLEAIKALGCRRAFSKALPLAGALSDGDERVRLEAARALQRVEATCAVPHLARAALEDGSAHVRCESLRALLRVDRARALDVALASRPTEADEGLAAARARFEAARRRWGERAVRRLAPLLGHPSAAVRRGAASALGQTACADAVQPLIAALSDASVPVRLEAARALGALGDPRGLPALGGSLRDPDHLVRTFAAEALGKVSARTGDPSGLPALASALVDPAPAVRLQVVASIGRVADAQRDRGWPCSPLERQLVIDALSVALTDHDTKVVIAASRLAISLQDARLVRPLLAALRHPEAYRGVFEPVIAALRRIGQAAESPLLRALYDADPRLRARVAQVLGALELPGAPGALMEVLGDAVPAVRAAAAQALGDLREGRALGLLLVALRDADPDVAARSAQALGKIGDPRAVPALARVVTDLAVTTRKSSSRLERPVYAVLAAAVGALGMIGDVRGLEPLVQALGHGDWRVRRDVADALGRLGDGRAESALNGALLDDERLVRRGAAAALRTLRRAA